MPYTVTECADFIKLSLGGKPSAPLSTLALVNMAGHYFTSLSKWRFLQRKQTLLDFVDGQTYLDGVPSDFGGIVSLVGVGQNLTFAPSDIDEIMRLRNAGATSGQSTGVFLYCVIDSTPSGSTAAVRLIEMFDTPNVDLTGAASLTYWAKWAELTDEKDYILLPDWTKVLFIRCLQAHARGLMEEDQASLSARLNEIRTSPELIAAVKLDRRMQSDRGELMGALSEQPTIDRYYTPTILGP